MDKALGQVSSSAINKPECLGHLYEFSFTVLDIKNRFDQLIGLFILVYGGDYCFSMGRAGQSHGSWAAPPNSPLPHSSPPDSPEKLPTYRTNCCPLHFATVPSSRKHHPSIARSRKPTFAFHFPSLPRGKLDPARQKLPCTFPSLHPEPTPHSTFYPDSSCLTARDRRQRNQTSKHLAPSNTSRGPY